jgi:hypothetical protein
MRGDAGQTTTEYLMISGFFTAVAILVIKVMQKRYQKFLQDLVTWLLEG